MHSLGVPHTPSGHDPCPTIAPNCPEGTVFDCEIKTVMGHQFSRSYFVLPFNKIIVVRLDFKYFGSGFYRRWYFK